MTILTFDKEAHKYFKEDGNQVLSVTQYLKLAGFIDDEWYSVEGRQRGQAVHAAIHYLNEADLDDSSLHPIVQPYVAAYRKFLVDTGFKPQLVEHRIYDSTYGYAGTLDVTGTWNLSDGLVLLDYKTGAIEDHVALQLAAYASCLAEPHHRFALQLKNDGTYRLSNEYKDRSDLTIFRALVATVSWRIVHGLVAPLDALAA